LTIKSSERANLERVSELQNRVNFGGSSFKWKSVFFLCLLLFRRCSIQQ
jgi:hypothetical protein